MHNETYAFYRNSSPYQIFGHMSKSIHKGQFIWLWLQAITSAVCILIVRCTLYQLCGKFSGTKILYLCTIQVEQKHNFLLITFMCIDIHMYFYFIQHIPHLCLSNDMHEPKIIMKKQPRRCELSLCLKLTSPIPQDIKICTFLHTTDITKTVHGISTFMLVPCFPVSPWLHLKLQSELHIIAKTCKVPQWQYLKASLKFLVKNINFCKTAWGGIGLGLKYPILFHINRSVSRDVNNLTATAYRGPSKLWCLVSERYQESLSPQINSYTTSLSAGPTQESKQSTFVDFKLG